MTTKTTRVESDDIWEDRIVGADDEFAEVAPDINGALNVALDLRPISIRLQKSLVDNLKALAHLHGLSYQPLVRQILTRWVDSEVKQMLVQQAKAVPETQVIAPTTARPKPVASHTKQRKAA